MHSLEAGLANLKKILSADELTANVESWKRPLAKSACDSDGDDSDGDGGEELEVEHSVDAASRMPSRNRKPHPANAAGDDECHTFSGKLPAAKKVKMVGSLKLPVPVVKIVKMAG